MSDDAAAPEAARQAVLNSTSAAEFDRWERPEFAPGKDHSAAAPGISISQLELLQQQAYEESYAIGMSEGRAAGEAETLSEAKRFTQLIGQLAKPFEALDDSVEKQVVHLAMIVARSVIRRELKSDPSHVIGAVREALSVLPIAASEVRVRLHPEDAALVRKHLIPTEGERAWTIQEDPVLTRGGCRVDAEHSHVDARVESRLSSLIASVLGDERSGGDRTDARDASS